MSSIIETMINAKKYYDEGVNCTLRVHNFTSSRIITEKVGPNGCFESATPPPLFISKDKYGDAIFASSKFFKGTLNVFYSININNKNYGIHINYIWKELAAGEIKVIVVGYDTLYPEKEKWVPLFNAATLSHKDLPFEIRYMASGSFVEIGVIQK